MKYPENHTGYRFDDIINRLALFLFLLGTRFDGKDIENEFWNAFHGELIPWSAVKLFIERYFTKGY